MVVSWEYVDYVTKTVWPDLLDVIWSSWLPARSRGRMVTAFRQISLGHGRTRRSAQGHKRHRHGTSLD